MAADPIATIRKESGPARCRDQERRSAISRRSICTPEWMRFGGELAAAHGLAALESLARSSAQRALLPGHRIAMQSCLEHVDEALDHAFPKPTQRPFLLQLQFVFSDTIGKVRCIRGAMRAFSQLLDDLVYTRSRNTKLKLIGDYLRSTPDPDRGYGLAALTGSLDIPHIKPAAVRFLVEERVDPVLFRMSRDYVGDTAETVALLWPKRTAEPPELDDATISIAQAVERLRSASRLDAPHVLAEMLDHLDGSGRYALLKLALGELRVGIHARLAKQALAQAFGLKVEAVEEVWHGQKPPFTELFDWADGRTGQPDSRDLPVFRPFMLAHALDHTRVSLDDYAAEWKWDGIRVQLVHAGGKTRLYSRTGDDISLSFPGCCRRILHKGRS